MKNSTSIFAKKWDFVKSWVRSDPGYATFMMLLGVMSIVYLILPLTTPQTYISPDESVSAHMAHSLATQGTLWYIEPLNIDAFDRIHPRAMESHGGLVHPSGFWGISLIYGSIGSKFGVHSMHVITVLMSLFGVWLLVRILEAYVGPAIALLSGALVLLHPVWWHYISRGWHHNGALVSLIIMLIGVLQLRPCKQDQANNLIASLCAFLIILIRPVSIIWLTAPILFLWITCPSLRKQLIYVSTTMVASAITWFLIHTQLWTHFSATTNPSALADTSRSFINMLLPHGYQIKQVIASIWRYGIVLTWWIMIPAILYSGYYLWEKRSHIFKKQIAQFGSRKVLNPFEFGTHKKNNTNTLTGYIIIWILVTVVLWLWYGAWNIADNPDGSYVTVANSYARYWLPSYIMAIPLAIKGYALVSRKIPYKHTFSIILGIICALSIYTVMHSRDGIPAMITQLNTNHAIVQEVIQITGNDSIIISNRHDKLFFPHRKVMFPIDHPGTFETIQALIPTQELYMYGEAFDDQLFNQINQVLQNMPAHLQEVATFDSQRLYRIVYDG